LTVVGDRAREIGDWDAAVAFYSKALARDFSNASLWVQYGHALKESGKLADPAKLAQAEIAYRRALFCAPWVADTHVQIGHVLKLQGRIDGAKEAYLRALALDPALSPAGEELRALGWEEADGAELKAALASLEANRVPRRRRRSLIQRGDAARDAAQWALASRYYRAALKRMPNNAAIWVQYGHAVKEAGNLKDPALLAESEAAYRRSLVSAGHIADTHLQLGRVLNLQGKIVEAKAAYLCAFALDPSLIELDEVRELGWSQTEIAEISVFVDRTRNEVSDEVLAGAGPIRDPDTTNADLFSALTPVTDPEISCPKRPAPNKVAVSISILVPLFNHAPYIRQALESVLEQSSPADEIVLIDDGSGDEGLTIAKRVLADDTRAHIFHQPNRGAHATINRLVETSRSDYLAILNSDDIFLPGKLARCREVIAEHKGVGLVCGKVAIIDDAGARVTSGENVDWLVRAAEFLRVSGMPQLALLLHNSVLTTSNMVFSRKLWRRVGGFQNLRYCHDLDFLMCAFARGGVVIDAEIEHILYRVHPMNTIKEDPTHTLVEIAAVVVAALNEAGTRILNERIARHEIDMFYRVLDAKGMLKLMILLQTIYADLRTRPAFYAYVTDPARAMLLREFVA